ncbi:TonB-linked SusC/RagA family outer membrane protein [Filimonas zeae]|uniref:SusC/RagA family TonB-linked outer membrane protein n=1 Tax=Filimonas zeae TaxID=1737353 RepID=A0A917ILR1_9BACT|nr:TonB-dependent receptor [Filimonas zeae]MDR6337202.1 TonB-linked SusC/RagA family outer membrane protein [Filimonas zeae]GGH57478.1 SusC/RagA family TonB-linked outer membrane protein [Filimonas zeae]
MKKSTLLVGFILFTCALYAQTRSLKGKVTDEKNAPLPGVSVVLKGGGTGTQTNDSGEFTLKTSKTGTVELVFSYTGYKMITVPTDGSKDVFVKLDREANDLNDIVVVGYQTVRRKDLTASVSSVGAKDLKDIPVNSAAEALAGRLAGVQVSVSEGAPGADVDIYVRGRNSITQSGSPLYVVDGVQMENALNVLSPQDIESVDVLKDAASTAIYGARGSNGVVIITTKGGKNTGGKTTVTYNGFVGMNKLSKNLDMMDPYNFVLYQYERAKYTENPTDTSIAAQYIKRMDNYDTIARTYSNYVNPIDWQDKMMGRNALFTSHNISVSGGTATTQYNLSTTYNKQEGLLLNSDFTRKLLNFRFDHKASEKVKVGFNVRYNDQSVTGAGTSDVGGAGSNRLRQYTRYRPLVLPGQTEDFYDATLDANNPGNGLNLLNPIQLMNAEYRRRNTVAYNFNGYVNISLSKRLSFRSTFGYDVNAPETKSYDDTLTANARAWSRMPILTWTNATIKTINNSNVFTYSNPSLYNSKHGLDVLAGQEIYEYKYAVKSQEVRYFPVGTKPDIAFANLTLASPPSGFAQPKPSSSEYTNRQLSFLSRINYNYNKKYLLTLNFRADGSSLFGPNYSSVVALSDSTNRKWGYFTSGSVAWRISQEKFFQPLTFINDAKIRFSYGQAGNNRINPYGFTTGYVVPTSAGYGLNDVLAYTLTPPNRLGNTNITWETTISRNLGFDLSFLNNRVNLTVDMYVNTTNRLLVDNAIPATSGYSTQYQNVGSTRNKGLEIQLSGTVMRKKDFNWNSTFNISFNRNKITSLGNQKQFLANSGWFSSTGNPADYLLRVGDEVGSMYGLQVDGFYTVDDFDATPYTGSYAANYPNLGYQYTLKKGLPNPAAVLADFVQPGQIKYRDVNGSGAVTLDSDRVVIGHALPKFTGGFNQQFTWKNFDMSVFVNFVYGNNVYNANKLEYSNAYGVDANMLATMNDRWRVIDGSGNLVQKQPTSGLVIGVAPEQLRALNANAKIWTPIRTTTGFYPSSYAIEDGSYLRINNITLGYTLPRSILNRVKLASVRFYGTLNNVATITGYSGYDPDVSTRRGNQLTPGVDYAGYPRGRSYIFGVNVSF